MDFRFTIVCLIGFAGFFRIDELIHVQLQHLTFNSDHMIVTLDKSKTDQHRDGHHVYIAQTNTEFCPIFHVRQFLALADLQPGRDVAAYLIPTLHKTKTGHLASKTKGISYSCIRDIFITKYANSTTIPVDSGCTVYAVGVLQELHKTGFLTD